MILVMTYIQMLIQNQDRAKLIEFGLENNCKRFIYASSKSEKYCNYWRNLLVVIKIINEKNEKQTFIILWRW